MNITVLLICHQVSPYIENYAVYARFVVLSQNPKVWQET